MENNSKRYIKYIKTGSVRSEDEWLLALNYLCHVMMNNETAISYLTKRLNDGSMVEYNKDGNIIKH